MKLIALASIYTGADERIAAGDPFDSEQHGLTKQDVEVLIAQGFAKVDETVPAKALTKAEQKAKEKEEAEAKAKAEAEAAEAAALAEAEAKKLADAGGNG